MGAAGCSSTQAPRLSRLGHTRPWTRGGSAVEKSPAHQRSAYLAGSTVLLNSSGGEAPVEEQADPLRAEETWRNALV